MINLPDGRVMGYSPADLNLWYDRIGVEGCKVYIQGANWDFVPVMIVYPLFLGAMLTKLARAANKPQKLSYLPLVAVACDAVETFVQRQGCVVYPERLSDELVTIAGHACQMKWIFLVGSILALVGLHVHNSPPQGSSSNKTEAEKKQQ